MCFKFVVSNTFVNERLDKFLAVNSPNISRSKIKVLIDCGNVTVNSCVVNIANYRMKNNDVVVVSEPVIHEITEPDLSPDPNVEFAVVYEDDDLLVVDKPAGLVVHPGAGNFSNTLVNGLIYHCGNELSSGSHIHRPGIVHRIDKDTSGILVIAKSDFAHASLAKQFEVHSIVRKYVCFCYGIMKTSYGKFDTLIDRDPNNRLRMAVSNTKGKRAITYYNVIKYFSKFFSKVECRLETGKTHQIRVHMSNAGHTLIGDNLYKMKNYAIPKIVTEYINNFSRQALHAYYLEFTHPVNQKRMTFTSELPDDLKSLERILNETVATISD